MQKVAFVGLGNMGRGIAGRLLETGHPLHLYNRTASRADALLRRGAKLYASPREACQGVGAGTAYKLIINMIGAVQIASAAEGVAIAECVGLDMAAVADAMATSQASSPRVVRNTLRVVAEDQDDNIVFTSALRLKDVEYDVRLARAAGKQNHLLSQLVNQSTQRRVPDHAPSAIEGVRV